MIKKLVVCIFCILVITAGFSIGILAQQYNTTMISESIIVDTEVVSYEVSSDTDADTMPSSYLLDTLDQQ